MFLGELYENVFQGRTQRANFRDSYPALFQLLAKVFQVEMIVDQGVNGLPENRSALDARDGAHNTQRPGYFRRSDFYTIRAGRGDVGKLLQFARSAVGDHPAVIDVGDMATALRLVHVVRSHKKGDAVAGEFEEQIPELPARHGIDSRSRLIQED